MKYINLGIIFQNIDFDDIQSLGVISWLLSLYRAAYKIIAAGLEARVVFKIVAACIEAKS